MAQRGGNAAKKIEPEINLDAASGSVGAPAANEDVEIAVDSISGDGVSASQRGNVIEVDFKNKIRTPPTVKPTVPTAQKNKTPAELPASAPSTPADTTNDLKTPPEMPEAVPGGDDFNNDMLNKPAEQASGPFVQSTEPDEGPNAQNMYKGNGPSGDLLAQNDNTATSTKPASKQPEQLTSVDQQAAADDLGKAGPQSKVDTATDKENSDEQLPPIFTGVATKVPLFGTLVRMYQLAPLRGKLTILDKMQRVISATKMGGAVLDGVEQWSIIWAPLIPLTLGLILLIAFPILIIQLFVYASLQEVAPSPLAKKFAEVLKIIETMIAKIKTKIESEDQRKSFLQKQRQRTIQANAAKQAAEATT